MSRPIASLSLDMDNLWSYLKTHGDPGWQAFPSYLDAVVPRALDMLNKLGLRITFFIVGQDADLPENSSALRAISNAGHEIGSHSYHHEPWLHLYTEDEIEQELERAETAIERATGAKPRGFRGPGFSHSSALLRALARRGYQYDASTFPTFLGPLARAYYFMTARLSAEEMEKRKRLFGRWSEGLKPLRPYMWSADGHEIVEIPVTTMPVVRTPIHVSYLLYMASYSPAVACWYFRSAMRMCRWTGTPLSLLLHPLDFLDDQDAPQLGFFPAMKLPHTKKAAVVYETLASFAAEFDVVSLDRHAESVKRDACIGTGR